MLTIFSRSIVTTSADDPWYVQLESYVEHLCTAFEFDDSNTGSFSGTLGLKGHVSFSFYHTEVGNSSETSQFDFVPVPVTGLFDPLARTGTATVSLDLSDLTTTLVPFEHYGLAPPDDVLIVFGLSFSLQDDTVLTGTAAGTFAVADPSTILGPIAPRPFNLTVGPGCVP